MRFILLIILSLLFIEVKGQSATNCDIGEYTPKNKFGQPVISEILWNNLDSLTKNFKNENTFSLKFYCFIKAEIKDSSVVLNTENIYIIGKNSIDAKNWEEDFKTNLKLIIKKFEPLILSDSLINSNCETLIFQSTVRRCR